MTQELLREEWDGLDTPARRVYDEEGRNIANAQIRSRCNPSTRRVSDAPGEENPGYLYCDDVEGFRVLEGLHALQLLLTGPRDTSS